MSRKILKYISLGTLAGIMSLNFMTPAFASVDGYLVSKDGRLFSYSAKELEKSAIKYGAKLFAPLYEDFLKGQVIAYHDDVKQYINAIYAEKAAIKEGKKFNLDDYTSRVSSEFIYKPESDITQKKVDDKGNVIEENESNSENDLELLKDLLNRIPNSPIIEIDNLEKANEEIKISEIKKLIESRISDNNIKIEFITELYKDVYVIKLIKNSASVEKVISVGFEEFYTDEEILNSKLETINVKEVFIDNMENATIKEKLKAIDLAVRNQTWLSFYIKYIEKDNEFKIVAEYNGIVREKIIKVQFQELETEEEIINQAVENIKDGTVMSSNLEYLSDKKEREIAVEEYLIRSINDYRIRLTVNELEVGKYKVNLSCESVKRSKIININFDEYDEVKLDKVQESLQINENVDCITDNLVLPKKQEDVEIIWKSSDESILTNEGVVNRPSHKYGDKNLELIATLKIGELQREKIFYITIKALDKTEIEEIDEKKENLRYNFDFLVKKYSDYRYTEESREKFNNFVEENRKKINSSDVTLDELEECISDLEDKCENELVLQPDQEAIELFLKKFSVEKVYVDNLETSSNEEKEKCIIKYIEDKTWGKMIINIEKGNYESQYKITVKCGNAVSEKNIKVNFEELETEEEKLTNILNKIMNDMEIEVESINPITDSEKCFEIDKNIQNELQKINYLLDIYTYVEHIHENIYKVSFRLNEIEKTKKINVIFIESK